MASLKVMGCKIKIYEALNAVNLKTNIIIAHLINRQVSTSSVSTFNDGNKSTSWINDTVKFNDKVIFKSILKYF